MLMEHLLSPFLLPALLDLQHGLKKFMYHVASALPLLMYKYSVQILFDIIYHYSFISFIPFYIIFGGFFFSILQCTT